MPTLRHIRVERLLTIRALAKQAGVAPSTIYLAENGHTIPRLSVIRRLAATLAVEPGDIDEFRQAIEQAKGPRGVHVE